jgi:flagellin FlaB
VNGVRISFKFHIISNKKGAIGIGALIIFISMILVAGIAANVLIQTMGSLQEKALQTGEETLRDISGGIKVTHISGRANSNDITQLGIFVSPTASANIDLTNTYISISDTTKNSILNYDSNIFSSTVSNGLFSTVNSSNLTATTFGIIVIRDIDSSCSASSPTIDDNDLVVLLINTSKCFSGIDNNVQVFGNIYPEYGMSGVISFTTPSSYVETIIDLQP